MRHWVLPLCVGALLLSACVSARADEEKVELDKLPKAVTEAVKKRFPKAKFVSASKEVEDKKTLYEVRIKDGEQTVEVTATPEGEVVEVEKEIAAKDLPKEVRATLNDKYPMADIKKAEEIYSGKEVKDLAYEVLLVTKDKKTYEVKFDPKGKVLNVEEKKSEDKEEKGEKKEKSEKKGEGKKGKEEKDEQVEQRGQNQGDNRVSKKKGKKGDDVRVEQQGQNEGENQSARKKRKGERDE